MATKLTYMVHSIRKFLWKGIGKSCFHWEVQKKHNYTTYKKQGLYQNKINASVNSVTYTQKLQQISVWYSKQLQIPKKAKIGQKQPKMLRKCQFMQKKTKHSNFHTSTLEAKKTHVGAMSTGSILFREYLQHNRWHITWPLIKSLHRGAMNPDT